MSKKEMRLLLLSIIGLIAVFLPYGLIYKMYSLYADKNCYLWKMFDVDYVYQNQKLVIIDVINKWNAIFIIIVAILTMILSTTYVILGKKFLEPIIKWCAIIGVVANLIFSYNLTEPLCYKSINTGMILAFLCNAFIVSTLTEFKKRNWIILAIALIISLPSMIINFRIDIEGGIYSIPCSIQTHIHSFISGIVYGNTPLWTTMPTFAMIIAVLLMVIAVFGEFKHKNFWVVCSIISFIIMFVFEIVLVIRNELSIILTYTYVIAIVLSIIYLIINKKDKKINN